MKMISPRFIAATVVAAVVSAAMALALGQSAEAEKLKGKEQGKAKAEASPIYGVTIPAGYRQWEFIAPAQEAEPLNELRIVVGNPLAMKAYREGTLPFPDGSVLVKLAWKHVQSTEFAPASVPGAATTVQVMVKDSKKYADTGGWGFGRFIDGKPADKMQHQSCFECHQTRVKGHDIVFTRLASCPIWKPAGMKW